MKHTLKLECCCCHCQDFDTTNLDEWESINNELYCPICAEYKSMEVVKISERIKDAMSIAGNEIFKLKFLLN